MTIFPNRAFTLACSTPGCGTIQLFWAPIALMAIRRQEVAAAGGWQLGTRQVELYGGSAAYIPFNLCPFCVARRLAVTASHDQAEHLAGVEATPIHQAEPVGHLTGDGVDDVTTPGTFPPPPAGAPAAGTFEPSAALPPLSFRAPAGATGIGPCVGRQPAPFSPDDEYGRGIDTAGMTPAGEAPWRR